MSNNGHGVQIPNPKVCGDAAAHLLADLHERAELSGYGRVRIDRGMHHTGAWYELGYSYGEIKVRLSHLPAYLIIRVEPNTPETFEETLLMNVVKAEQAETGKKAKR